MNKRTTQYSRETVMNDYLSEINISRDNLKKRLNKEKQDSNDLRTRQLEN